MVKRVENTKINGEITEALPNTMFRVRLIDGREVIGVPSGKMRRGFRRLLPGVAVVMEMTPYDDKRGRIIAKR
ncbi:MAG: Translation initiation factor IF-1 [Candidatus Woesebacteria bacterium GW2011_GWB1_43_14]|uniref:Translation initiation factor IF-1 n=1 Tax=Candidatus Woesebacteria bacterium GW2011_GWB1_43_14 TaxID=1618578 RepID=A0A0G1DIG3_9BACT|nr:MAG: Translation initiation factor IF-1 [Candidatus Woesebacteria bacterium GW2011_GWA1_39_11b]KKS78038.1 MAG: Translation initiation factor IF-1 [Candidatus Woesebacteria bacterium GW2011_GWC1_42_9]KKS97382.1 MAG: Translation initiation factor IF-1 [Candidatus Woesebacteria bacterium GW2011_GWB1_43_14]